MRHLKIFIFILFIVFSSLTNIVSAESLKFAESTYEGEVKKGKAHGEGVITFSDGTIYQGKFKKNKPHGLGVYTDVRENTYEGKWRHGKFKSKIDKKTRKIIKLSAAEGQTSYFEIKGKGTVASEWFEAKEDSPGAFTLTKKGKRDLESKKNAAASSSTGGSSS